MKNYLDKIRTPGEHILISMLKFAGFLFTGPGFNLIRKIVLRSVKNGGFGTRRALNYQQWIMRQNKLLAKQYRSPVTDKDQGVLFSVVSLPIKWEVLKHLITQLEKQSFRHFECCVGLSADESYRFLNEIEELTHGIGFPIKVIAIDALAVDLLQYEAVIAQAVHPYAMLIPNNTLLEPYCFSAFADAIQNAPVKPSLVYADEDEQLPDGQFAKPKFKPAWSPHYLFSGNYIGDLFCIDKELLLLNNTKRVSGMPPLFASLLSLAFWSIEVLHIPYILSHQRGTQLDDNTLSDRGKKAIDAELAALDWPGEAIPILGGRQQYQLQYKGEIRGLVSIIIPSKDQAPLLDALLQSIIAKTVSVNYEIIVVNNNSTSADFFDLIARYKLRADFRCVDHPGAFNFSAIINFGAQQAKGEYLLLLNNDMEVVNKHWLYNMVATGMLPRVGAVGAKLLFGNDTLQHAGIVLDRSEISKHIYISLPSEPVNEAHHYHQMGNYLAVTGAALLVKKQLFERVGGMDEDLPVEYNDVAFCLSLVREGYYNVYTPNAVLYHYESATRGHPFKSITSWRQHEHDRGVFIAKWGQYLDKDPFLDRGNDFGFMQ